MKKGKIIVVVLIALIISAAMFIAGCDDSEPSGNCSDKNNCSDDTWCSKAGCSAEKVWGKCNC